MGLLGKLRTISINPDCISIRVTQHYVKQRQSVHLHKTPPNASLPCIQCIPSWETIHQASSSVSGGRGVPCVALIISIGATVASQGYHTYLRAVQPFNMSQTPPHLLLFLFCSRHLLFLSCAEFHLVPGAFRIAHDWSARSARVCRANIG